MVGLPAGAGSLFSRSTRWRLLGALAGSVLVALTEVVSVLAVLPLMQLLTGATSDTGALRWLRDHLGHPDDNRLGLYLAGFVFAGFAIKGLSHLAYRWWVLGFIADQEVRTSVRILRHLLRADYAMHLSRSKSDMIRAMSDAVGQVYGQTVVGGISVLTEAVTLTALTGVLLFTMPVPTVVAVAYFGAAGYLLQRVTRHRVSQAGEDMLQASKDSYATALHALDSVKEIKLRNSSSHFVDAFAAARRMGAGSRRRAIFFAELPRAVLEVLFIAGVVLMAAIIFASHARGQAVALLALFIAAGFRVLPSLARMLQSFSNVRIGLKGTALVVAEIAEAERTTETEPYARATASLPFADALRLEGLSFRYARGPEVVRDVDLVVPAGTSLALVGGSGAGKSTLVDLVLGLHTPTGGRILVDGVDIAGRMLEWQRDIAMVPQDVILFDADLATNIAFDQRGDEIDRDLLAQVVRDAQLDELVAGLPEGLDTFVGGGGIRLSGGQEQRVGIARALYRRPKLLVLDEATSALDNLTERKISETIQALQGRVTMVIVAHRLSTVRHCDQLVYMSHGRVAAAGTFDGVRRTNAEFARLVELGSLEPVLEER